LGTYLGRKKNEHGAQKKKKRDGKGAIFARWEKTPWVIRTEKGMQEKKKEKSIKDEAGGKGGHSHRASVSQPEDTNIGQGKKEESRTGGRPLGRKRNPKFDRKKQRN